MPLFNGWNITKSNPDTERFHLNKILSAIQTAVNSAALTTWGSITGTLSTQTDLQAALDAKEAIGTAAAAVAAHEAAGEHTQLDLPEITEPAAPSADTVRLYATDSNGISELEMKDSTGLVRRIGEELLTRVRNTTGATLAIGSAVYVTGSTGSTPTVALARSDSDATTPCVGLVVEAIPNNGFGRVISKGTISNVDTSAFTEGNPVYLSATVAGGLTSTAPTHPNLLQKVGTVTNVGVGNGKILVSVDAVVRPLTQSITNGDTTHAPSSDAVFDALAGYQPLDATLTALSGANWSLDAIPIGTGPDTVSQVAFAANTFPARASTGTLVAKPISDDALDFLAAANDAAMRTDLGLGTVAVRNEGNNAPGLVPLITSPGGGQNSLRVSGSSGRANYETESLLTDTAGAAESTFSAYATGSVSGSVEKRLGLLGFYNSGSTANNRGGQFRIVLKQNGSTTLTDVLYCEYTGSMSFGAAPSYGSGVRVFFFPNATTVPTTNPTGGFIAYGDSGSAKIRTPGGNVVTIAPNTAPSVTGSRGGNAALASLLTTLAAAGIIADNTTA